jgi:hypothetical protein
MHGDDGKDAGGAEELFGFDLMLSDGHIVSGIRSASLLLREKVARSAG